jgi:hypothetical protein
MERELMQTLFKSIAAPIQGIPATRLARNFTIIAPLYAAVIVGTASGYSAANLGPVVNSLSHSVLVPISTGMSIPELDSPDVTVSSLLRIRDVFALNMTELALIFGISRPALYAWMRGVRPKRDALQQIWKLEAAAQELESLKLHASRPHLRFPIFGGKTLFDLMLSKGDVLSGVRALARHFESKGLLTLHASQGRVRRRSYTADDISQTVKE